MVKGVINLTRIALDAINSTYVNNVNMDIFWWIEYQFLFVFNCIQVELLYFKSPEKEGVPIFCAECIDDPFRFQDSL